MKRYWNIEWMRHVARSQNLVSTFIRVCVWAPVCNASKNNPFYFASTLFRCCGLRNHFPHKTKTKWKWCVCGVDGGCAPHKMFHIDICCCLCIGNFHRIVYALWFAQHCRKMCKIHHNFPCCLVQRCSHSSIVVAGVCVCMRWRWSEDWSAHTCQIFHAILQYSSTPLFRRIRTSYASERERYISIAVDERRPFNRKQENLWLSDNATYARITQGKLQFHFAAGAFRFSFCISPTETQTRTKETWKKI